MGDKSPKNKEKKKKRAEQKKIPHHGQLEKIYPNLMQIERPNLNIGGTLREERLD